MNTADNGVDGISGNSLMEERRQKLDKIRQSGKVAFPNDIRPKHTILSIIEKFKNVTDEKELENFGSTVIAGRIMAKRIMGKASFIQIKDGTGLKLQAYVSKDKISEEKYNEFKTFDIGDIVMVGGTLFRTKTDELTINTTEIRMVTKSLRPLPEKFHGLTDQESKYRMRYVDLIMNDKSREVFIKRSKIISYIRSFFQRHGFLEVETPMMHPIPGGAAARPFVTHHNALDIPIYMRISPELYLKRLVVGGLERVFEINRNFRNEGVSARHNPEFTMIEFYQAYADYNDLMDITEKLFRELADLAIGKRVFDYQGTVIDFESNFARLPMFDAVKKYLPQYNDAFDSKEKLAEILKKDYKMELLGNESLNKLRTLLFEEGVEHLLVQPTFITQYPAEMSPLSRRNDKNPEFTDRFELFIGGREIANAFSELNDAEDQAERFKEQAKAFEAGDEEAMHYDADYVRALEYGMPPTAGEGIGVDRLIMLLTNSASIRDVLLFPLMRPE